MAARSSWCMVVVPPAGLRFSLMTLSMTTGVPPLRALFLPLPAPGSQRGGGGSNGGGREESYRTQRELPQLRGTVRRQLGQQFQTPQTGLAVTPTLSAGIRHRDTAMASSRPVPAHRSCHPAGGFSLSLGEM